MKYYKNGDLRSFMIENQSKFDDLVRNRKLELGLQESELGQGAASTSDDELVKFSTKDLIRWSEGIAAGMEFLQEKHVSSLNLAAFFHQ